MLNENFQMFNGIKLQLINRKYQNYNAKRFAINETNQNVWIPNKHLEDDGTIKPNQSLGYIFNSRLGKRKLKYAGVEDR